MNDKMRLLIVKQTRHVLGAVTQAAKDDQVLGTTGILVRFGKKVAGAVTTEKKPFEVPVQELEATPAVNLDLAVFLQPREYLADDGGQPVKITQTTSVAVDLKSDKVTVTLPGSDIAAEDTNVWVQIDGDNLPSTRVVTGTIKKDENTCTLEIAPLENGSYFLVALVKGYLMFTGNDSFP